MTIEQIFISIVILFAGARILGELFKRIKQPALGGELLAGIIIGPTGFITTIITSIIAKPLLYKTVDLTNSK